MYRWFWGIAVLFMAAMIVSQPVGAAGNDESGFVPQLKVGDKWVLEARYRDMKNPGEPWLPPIRWVFRVRALKNIHRQDCYVIHVYPQKSSIKVQAVLFLSTIDLRPMRVIDIFPTPNGVKSKERDVDPFHPQPLLAQDSLVPYDLPVFPLIRKNIQGQDSFESYQAPAPKSFSKITNLSGFRFKRSIQQSEKQADKQHADSFAAYQNGGELFQIEMFDTNTKGNLTQIWQEGSPWALSSESYSRKVSFIPPVKNPAPPANQPAPGGER